MLCLPVVYKDARQHTTSISLDPFYYGFEVCTGIAVQGGPHTHLPDHASSCQAGSCFSALACPSLRNNNTVTIPASRPAPPSPANCTCIPTRSCSQNCTCVPGTVAMFTYDGSGGVVMLNCTRVCVCVCVCMWAMRVWYPLEGTM